MENKTIIAIDGPAAAGKGVLARFLAEHYHLPHLDTGLTYRAAAHGLLLSGFSLNDKNQAVAAAEKVNLERLDTSILWSQEIAEAASQIASITEVRRILVKKQIDFGNTPPGAVLEGRDVGTVLFPQADVKFYITANQHIRGIRRLKDIKARGQESDLEQILQDIQTRDKRDMNREDSPLRQSPDAHLLDTTEMSIEMMFQLAKAIIDTALKKGKVRD